MGGLFSVFDLRSRLRFLISLLLLLILFISSDVFSEELNQDQPGTPEGSDIYQQIRAPNSESGNDKKLVAQNKSGAQNESQDQRIQDLENKLKSVSDELRQLKAEGIPDDRLQAIEEKLSVLAQEIDNIKQVSVIPEPTYEQMFGAGPAASKVYLTNKGLSIGGYGELLMGQAVFDGDDTVDTQRVVLYFGYKFTDRIIFNSEIEFEHASTGVNVQGDQGEVSVEFALLDFLLVQEINLRAGLLLAPFGIINEVHEPTTFFGVFRPLTERFVIPTTWRENGIGIFGDFDLSKAGNLSYKAYVMKSFNAKGFTASSNRGIRTQGDESLFNNVAFVGRAEYNPLPYLTVAGSIFLGNTGQDARVDDPESQFDRQKIKGFFQMYEGDIQVQYAGFEGRALAVFTRLDDAALINALNGFVGDDSVGNQQWGYYVEGGYNVLSLADFTSQYFQYLAPFVRWDAFDTQAHVPSGFERNPANNRKDLTIGINYKPIPQVVVKAEYQWLDNNADESQNQINFGLGYVF
ncbi:MAG TPA: hypothetical protein VLG45_00545 [Thermodesulfobacteriota bacterium]|nr:hypothetical protein [Thermodesulfobacteriota bacterium]